MRRVRMLWAGVQSQHKVGDIVRVSDGEAEALIDVGHAELAGRQPVERPAAESTVETATAAAAETTATRTRRPAPEASTAG